MEGRWPAERWEVKVDGGPPVRVLDAGGSGHVLLAPPSPGGVTAWIHPIARSLPRGFRLVSWTGEQRNGHADALACSAAVLGALGVERWSGLGWLGGFRTVERLSREMPAEAIIGLAPLFPVFGASDRRLARIRRLQRQPALVARALGVLAHRRWPTWILRRRGPVSPTFDVAAVRMLLGAADGTDVARALEDAETALSLDWNVPNGRTGGLAGGASVLLLCGERDWLAPSSVCRYALGERPNVMVREVPMASWLLPVEFSEYVGLLIEEHHHTRGWRAPQRVRGE